MRHFRLKRRIEHLKWLRSIQKSWDFFVGQNDGFMTGKLSLMTRSGQRVFTKTQFLKHIEDTKYNISKLT